MVVNEELSADKVVVLPKLKESLLSTRLALAKEAYKQRADNFIVGW